MPVKINPGYNLSTGSPKLQGRFLHITDLHPDLFYRVNATISSACHRLPKNPKTKKHSGYLGTPFTDCDSPLLLNDYTLDHLDKKWANEIDFVIWTGDNARHDNDRKISRTPKEIYQSNRDLANKMEEVFVNKGIPVIPTIGNNDVWPHNIMTPGPNSITKEFSSIWKAFVPFPSYQVFHRGGHFAVEVIPNELAVISLNTMYFFESNKAVGGCEFNEHEDPGNLQFDWLEVQLDAFRSRGLQVWIMGHVPPSPKNYFPECYVRYVEISLRFQDTIVGSLFGHMNVDYFSFLQADELEFPTDIDSRTEIMAHAHLDKQLLKQYEALPQTVDYSSLRVINVSPSVVPTYLPSFRVYSYNISEVSYMVKNLNTGASHRSKPQQCKEDKYRDTWRCNLSKSWHTNPGAPSQSNTRLSALGYAQYYMPKLETANETHRPSYRLEYLTYASDMLHALPGQEKFDYPIPLKLLPKALRTAGHGNSKYTPYELRDLTVKSWVGLAKEIADPANKRLREKFREYLWMGKGRG